MQRNVAGIWQRGHAVGKLRFKQAAQIVILSVATEGSAIEGSCRVTMEFAYKDAGMIALQLLCGNLSRFFGTPHARRLRMTGGLSARQA